MASPGVGAGAAGLIGGVSTGGILYGAYIGATALNDYFSEKEQGKIARESLEEQIRLVNEQRKMLVEAYEAKGDIITDIYGTRIQSTKDLFKEQTTATNIMGKELTYNVEESKARTGLAFSGSATRRGETEQDKFRSGVRTQGLQYRSQLDELKNRYRAEEFENKFEKDKVLSDLDISLANLRGQKRQAEAQENQKFLGIF